VPNLAYAVDSRIELFPPDLLIDEYTAANANGEWFSIFDKYDADVIVTAWEQIGQYDGLIVSPNWVMCTAAEEEGWIWLRATGDKAPRAGCTEQP
jgi:hypothetical protein